MTRTVIKGPPERSCTRSPRANSGAVSERAGTDESALNPRIRAASSDDRFAKVDMPTSPVIFQTWDRLFTFPIKFLVSRAYPQRGRNGQFGRRPPHHGRSRFDSALRASVR